MFWIQIHREKTIPIRQRGNEWDKCNVPNSNFLKQHCGIPATCKTTAKPLKKTTQKQNCNSNTKKII